MRLFQFKIILAFNNRSGCYGFFIPDFSRRREEPRFAFLSIFCSCAIWCEAIVAFSVFCGSASQAKTPTYGKLHVAKKIYFAALVATFMSHFYMGFCSPQHRC